ncbi:hypothetical protein I4U23_005419 [Adineta vaga]|nr:hypothetical protein I4U23_005419 [Adineta vaga]
MKLIIIFFFIFCCYLSTSHSQNLYHCDFEDKCEDFLFDSYWIVENISSHIDHTYGNLSGHYITYTNTSTSTPLTTFRTRNWVYTSANFTTCLTLWIYSGPGRVNYEIQMAQGDDLQTRLPVGNIGMNLDDPQWRSMTIEMPYVSHYIPYIVLTNITSKLDLDDISVSSCPTTRPIQPKITVLSCDFDENLCPELFSLPYYTYSWSVVEAQLAHNYTSDAPIVDYSMNDTQGHYIWVNNSRSSQKGVSGYLSTKVFNFTRDDPTFCLSFYYYGYGIPVENRQLSVFALTNGSKTSLEKIWPINPIDYKYAVNQWTWAYVSLPIGTYSLLFRTETNHPQSGSFTLDLIEISSCEYLQRYFYGISNLNFTCDFDSSADYMCGISNDMAGLQPQSTIDFTVQSPRTIDDRELGPTESSGYSGPNFLYWSRSGSSPTSVTSGQFKTPLLETSPDMCVRFSYFISSPDDLFDEPNMKLEVLTLGCANETIRTVKVDNTYRWEMLTTTLDNIICTQSIYFRITQQQPTRAAVAIDDITIGSCFGLPPLTTTTSTRRPSTTTLFNKTSSNYVNSIFLMIILIFLLKIHSSNC